MIRRVESARIKIHICHVGATVHVKYICNIFKFWEFEVWINVRVEVVVVMWPFYMGDYIVVHIKELRYQRY